MEEYYRYIDDTKFMDWVFSPTVELDQYWEAYIKEHPEDRATIIKLKVALFTFKSKQQFLNTSQKSNLLDNIQKSISTNLKKRKVRRLYLQTFKYAAAALLLFLVGTLINIQNKKVEDWPPMDYSTELNSSSNTQLILPDGTQINLEDSDSKVRYTKTGSIIVNKDTINTLAEYRQPNKLIQLIVPYGKKSRLSLPDGSIVYLNAGSRFIYPSCFEGGKREVRLLGEAFFDVAKDKQSPFIVRTQRLSVKVLGTQFNISAYPLDKSVETVLAEGSVKIIQNNKKFFNKDIFLTPGQMASYDNETGKFTVEMVDIENHILWKDGILKFENLELNRIVKKLERYYNINIGFNDPLTGMVIITGKLDLNTDMDSVLENLATTMSSEIKKLNDKNYKIM
ncbi:MAG: DUF4974 domain-containing protein [Chlorobi bacterium]|nr:DUF4974 domain-containing protein [Chlorobiota bacterium]